MYIVILSQQLKNCTSWLKVWVERMGFPLKTMSIFFSHFQKVSMPTIKLNVLSIEVCLAVKFLGLQFDEYLTWVKNLKKPNLKVLMPNIHG